MQENKDETMDQKNELGRRIVITFIAIYLGAWAVSAVANFYQSNMQRLLYIVFFSVQVVLCVFMYKGANWARLAQIAFLIFSGFRDLFLGLFFRFTLGSGDKVGLMLVAASLIPFSFAAGLLFVPAVKAYFKSGRISTA